MKTEALELYYLDSSAWVKRYFPELGTTWIRGLFDRREGLACSTLGYVEVAATLARQRVQGDATSALGGDIWARLAADWLDITALDVDEPVIRLAAGLARDKRLRGADAIHLATADLLRHRVAKHRVGVVFVTADAELIAAARAIGLTVFDPFKEGQQ